MTIRIITKPISRAELKSYATEQFEDLVKAVVDVEKGIMAVGGDMHADEEAALLSQDSLQSNLWGINLFPDKPEAEWLAFDSMINIRPSSGNRSRDVEDPTMRQKISVVVDALIVH